MTKEEHKRYCELRDHIHDLIINHLDVTLRDVCRWCGRKKRTEYEYVVQVLSGRYKAKISQKVVQDLRQALKDNNLWIPVGKIKSNNTKKSWSNTPVSSSLFSEH